MVKFYIEGVNVNSMSYDYKKIVDKWNDEEQEFRNKTRKQDAEYKNWYVKGRFKRQIIINGVKLYYNITRYKNKDNGKCFTYYHSKILRYIKRKKYYLKDVLNAAKDNNFSRKKPDKNSAKIPYSVYYYWKKTEYLSFQKPTTIFKNKTKNKILQIDIDDCYKKIRVKNKVLTARFRVLVFHTGYNHNKGLVENKTILIQPSFIPVESQKQKILDEKLIAEIKQIMNNFYDKLEVVVHGDGGQFINQIAKKLQVKRVFDRFHLNKIAFENLGWTKRKYKENQVILEEKFGNVFEEFKNYFVSEDINKMMDLLIKIKNYFKEIKKQNRFKKIESLIKLIKNHWNAIKNSMNKNLYYGGCPETWIGHDIKRFCNKKFAVFGLKSLISQITIGISENTNLIIN